MLNIKLREDLCKFAWDTVNKRNFGNRSVGANGSKEQQYTRSRSNRLLLPRRPKGRRTVRLKLWMLKCRSA